MVVSDWLAGLFSKPLTRRVRKNSSSLANRRNSQLARIGTESLECRALLSRASVALFIDELAGDATPGVISAGEEFDVRLHVSESVNDVAVFSGYADINFAPTHLEALSITHDPDYGSFGATGTIDNVNGVVDELGGSDGFSPPASSLIATIRFRAKTAGDSVITTDRGEATISQISSHNSNNSGDLGLDATFGMVAVNRPEITDFSIANATPASEGTGSNGSFGFVVTRTGDLTGAATIAYAVEGFETRLNNDSPATAADLVDGFASDVVSFVAGESTAVISLDAVGDAVTEGNESFAVTLNSPSVSATISDGFATATILDDDTPLEVVSFIPGHGSVGVVFSHPVNQSTLNLYDVQAGTFGPADVTLVGNTVGAVTGSLVVTGNTATFVPTGGVLAADTYTLTLRSGADAFNAEVGGVHLDGDQDGNAGGHYSNTFTLAAAEALVVEIPDFTRAPGQVVDVPANDVPVGLPILFSEAAGITSVELVVEYDPALLNISGVTLGADAPVTATLNANVVDPGYALVTFSSATALPAGAADLINLTATVPAGATYGAAHVLRITNLSVNDGAISGTQGAGIHTVVLFGDSTGNGLYSGLDAQRVAREVVQLDTGFAAFPLIDPVIVADINQNGGLTGLDAQRISQKVVNLDPDEIPKRGTFSKHEPARVDIPTDLTAFAGGTVVVPINIDDSHELESTDITLSYDTALFDTTSAQIVAGAVFADGENVSLVANVDEAAGTISITVNSTKALPATVGSLIEIEFDVVGSPTVGTVSPINLMTVLLEEGITVTPTPTVGVDAVDGVVTFVDPPVFSFDFALAGRTDFITSLDVNASDAIVLDVYARNANFVTASVNSYILDIDEAATADELEALITGYAAGMLNAPIDGIITDADHSVQFTGVPFNPGAETLLGTLTLSAPAVGGSFDLALGQDSAINVFGVADVPDAFNNLTINVASAAPQLIGVDFGGGTVPTNWTGQSGTSDITLTDLIDESGTATTIDVAIDFDDTLQGGNENFAPPASELPNHTQSLSGLDGAFEDQGNVELTFSSLTPGQSYELYVFAGDTFNGANRVTIEDNAGVQLDSFVQDFDPNQLLVNSSVGSSAQDLTSFAKYYTADSTGRLIVRVDSSPAAGQFFGLAGIAIREGNPPPPDVTIGDATANEADSTISFPVNLTTPASGDVVLTLTTSNGTALAGQDYTATTGQVTILSGASSGTFTVPIQNDTTAEPTETFIVSVQSVDLGVVGATTDTGTGTVTDDDGALTLSIVGAAISENGGVTTATVSRNTDTTAALTVTLLSSDTGEASVPVTVTIPAGQTTSAAFDITGVDDSIVDGTQTVTVTATAAAHADGTDTVDVTDDDVAGLTLAIVGASVSENGGVTTATVSRNTDTTAALTVTLLSSDTGEASVPVTVTIPAGQTTSAAFDITGVDDAIVDGTQTVTVTATAAAHADGTDTVDVTDDDLAGLTLAIVDASVSENGGVTSATVSRNTDTTAALTVTLLSSDMGEASVPVTVTISAGQTTSAAFDITGIDDVIVDGTQTVTVTATAAAHADGTDTVDVTDDDVAGLTLAIVGASVSENGGVTTATVSRNTDTTAALTVTLLSSDTGEASVPVTVTIPAGQTTSAAFDITGVDDAIVDGTQTVTVTATAAAHADGTDTVDVTDDDLAGLTLAIVDASVSENGGVTSATVSRNTDTTAALTVTLLSSDMGEASVPVTVTIPAGQTTSAAFDITGVDDAIVDGTQTVTVTATAAAHANGTDTVDVTDDDVAGLTLAIVGASVSENGGVTTATVSRNTDTTAALTVTLLSSDTGEASVPVTVTIPAGQTTSAAFDITGVDDSIVDGTQTVTVTATAAAHANGTDTVDITDDEGPLLTVAIIGTSISENGGVTTATVSRNTDTTADLTVTLVSSNTSEASVPLTVTIPAGQTTSAAFDITGVDDSVVDGTQTVTVTATAAAHADGTDIVDVTDDDVAGLTLAIVGASVSENGGVTTATVSRNTDTTAALTVTLLSSDTGEASVPVTVTIPAGQTTSAAFDITGVYDAVVDGTQAVIVTATAAAHADGTDIVDVTDDDLAGLTLVIVGASVSENGGVTTATVSRNTDTTAALTVTLSSSDTGEASVPVTVTIPAGQTTSAAFDITGVDDAVVDGTQAVIVTATAAAHADGTDTVDVTDDDIAGLTLFIVGSSINENGGVATATVSRNTDTTAALTVTLSSSDLSEASVPVTVIIPAGQTTSAAFDVTGVDDSIVDGAQTVTVTANAAAHGDGMDTVDVTDDDVAGVTLSIVGSSINENGGVSTATVSRNTDTTAALTVTLSSSDAGEASVPATVTIPAGQTTSAAFDITGVDDVIVDGTQTVTITASANGHSTGSDMVDVTDDDSLPPVIVELSMTLRELDAVPGILVGESFEIDVDFRDVVNNQSVFSGYADVVFDNTIFRVDSVTHAASYANGRTGTIDNLGGVVNEVGGTDGLTPPPDSTIFTLALTAIGDGTSSVTSDAGEDLLSEILSHDTGIQGDLRTRTDFGSLEITVLPIPELTLVITDGSIGEGAGIAATTGTVTRNTDTTAALTVTLSTDDTGEAAVPATVTIPAGKTSVTFDIDAVDDAVLDGTQVVSVTATAAGFTGAADSIDVIDDEAATVAIFAGSHGAEAGEIGPTAGSFRFALSTAADFDLTIPVTLSGSAVGDVDFNNFTSFTIPAGETSGEFFVNVIDDAIAERTDILRLQLDAPGVAGLTVDVAAEQARILMLDNDLAAINVNRTAVTVSESGTSTTFDVTLASEPTGPVTIEVFITDPTEVATDVMQLTFTPANWNVTQTITVTGVDDPDSDGSVESPIILFIDPVGAPDLFQFAPATEINVTTLDDEPAVGPVTVDSTTFYNNDADQERGLSPQQDGQRSLIRHIEVVLDGLVVVPAGVVADGSFAVQNTDDGSFVGLTVDSATQAGGKTTIVLSFTSGTDASGSLIDGNYELTVDGAPLGIDADDSGAVGGIQQTDFHRLFGDSDGDRDVDGRDIGNFRKALTARPTQPNVYSSVFDYDDDGQVFEDLEDLFAVIARYGIRLRP